ncbi:uncharacterized protein LOC125582405 [Brassica napus]|uniref:uncharacterized protein LOC125582405 n=1 Tax=Brassica napus TaxID=3708 RepID=UPI00207914B8|nr:uncharacterized protein LOC125582405 [Brassica napus]
MPFGLKNAGATYQRLVNRMFADQLGNTMEVYIDDMLVKSLKADDHLSNLRDYFKILNDYGMKLNPAKCTFGVTSGEFLGYIVTQRGIEANPKQISAILDLPSPKNSREVQRLTGSIAALNRFILRSTYKCLPFYELLRGNKRFVWDEKCEENTNQSERLTKWAMELSEHDIVYKNHTAAKSQVLAEFLIELTPELEQDLILPSLNWILHVDGSSTSKGSGAGMQLQSPTGELIRQSFSFGFSASNNEAEYESLIAGLRLVKAVKAKRISAYCDFQLVVSQCLGDYDVRNEWMDAYLKLAEQTAIAAAISEAMDIDEAEPPSQDDQPTDWRKELIDYLAEGLLPTEKWDARRLKRRSAHYVVMDGELHRWTATKVLLKCISGEETRLVMAETHEGAAGNHSGGRALSLKVKNLGFYWPTMNADCETYVRKCDKCQRHASTLHSPTEFLHTLTAPYPFMRWGMDIIGPMPASRQKKFILVLTDYFTKWVEAEAYASITDKEVQNFIWKNIICRHGLPYEIITDNGSQFISHYFKGFCDRWRIRLNMSTPSNGQADSTNKTIIDGLKK